MFVRTLSGVILCDRKLTGAVIIIIKATGRNDKVTTRVDVAYTHRHTRTNSSPNKSSQMSLKDKQSALGRSLQKLTHYTYTVYYLSIKAIH